jgi:hypothetical protein
LSIQKIQNYRYKLVKLNISYSGVSIFEKLKSNSAVRANTPSNKSWPDVAAGRGFTYQGDPNHPSTAPEQLLIAGCTFVLSHSGYESLPGAGAH